MAIAAWLLCANAATAATVTLEYEPALPNIEPHATYTLSVRDRAGHDNRIAVSRTADAYLVRDGAVPLTAGEGCQARGANEVRCATPRRARDHSVFVVAGEGGDIISVGALPPAATAEVRGGPEGDLLAGGPARDLLVGGPGDDWLAGADNQDDLSGGSGNDRLDGGAGRDRATYSGRRPPVSADLASGVGGQAGEFDVLTALEDLIGGRGADRLSGDSGPNAIHGGRGGARDVLTGRAGDDHLVGYRAEGGGGNDRIDARRFSCGAGADLLERLVHRTRGPFPAACEVIVADFIFMRPDPVARARRLVFEIKCPFENLACAAQLEARDRRGRVGGTRFRLHAPPSGPFKRVTLRLERRPAARVGTLHVRGRKDFDRDRFRIRVR